MKSWPSKILFVLVIFFAGFATAIYGLAPVDRGDETGSSIESKSFFGSFTKSNEFAVKCGNKLRIIVGLAEEAARRTGRSISDKGVEAVQVAALDKIRTFGITGTESAEVGSDQADK